MDSSVFSGTKSRWVLLVLVIGMVLPIGVLFTIEGFAQKWLGLPDENYILVIATALPLIFIWAIWLRGKTTEAIFGTMPPKVHILPFLGLSLPMVCIAIVGLYLLYYPISLFNPDLVSELLLESNGPFWNVDTWPMFATFVAVVFFAPVLEELVFRGYLLRRWSHRFTRRTALIGSSMAFSVMHLDPIGAMIFALILANVALRTESLVPCILIHMGTNLVAILWSPLDGWLPTADVHDLGYYQDKLWMVIPLLLVSLSWFYVFMCWLRREYPEGDTGHRYRL